MSNEKKILCPHCSAAEPCEVVSLAGKVAALVTTSSGVDLKILGECLDAIGACALVIIPTADAGAVEFVDERSMNGLGWYRRSRDGA